MLKKLLGLGKGSADRPHAGDAPGPARDETPNARPWLSISWQFSDVESSARVRRLAEDLVDRARHPTTIFTEYGACDAGLVTLRVHKDALREGLAPLADEAERIMRRIMDDAEPVLHPTEYVCVACPREDGANQQIVAMRPPDSRAVALERIVVREGDVVVREQVAWRVRDSVGR